MSICLNPSWEPAGTGPAKALQNGPLRVSAGYELVGTSKLHPAARSRQPSIPAYFEAMDKLFLDKDAVIYHDDGSVTIDYKN